MVDASAFTQKGAKSAPLLAVSGVDTLLFVLEHVQAEGALWGAGKNFWVGVKKKTLQYDVVDVLTGTGHGAVIAVCVPHPCRAPAVPAAPAVANV